MLTVAVVGRNYELSCIYAEMIAENDMDSKIVAKTKYQIRIFMEDGTRYIAFPSPISARSYCIDQIIIVDDNRWDVYKTQAELINELKYGMFMSCVPEEFLIIEYEVY